MFSWVEASGADSQTRKRRVQAGMCHRLADICVPDYMQDGGGRLVLFAVAVRGGVGFSLRV